MQKAIFGGTSPTLFMARAWLDLIVVGPAIKKQNRFTFLIKILQPGLKNGIIKQDIKNVTTTNCFLCVTGYLNLRVLQLKQKFRTQFFESSNQFFDFLLSTFLRNFFLCQDCVQGDVPPHLAQALILDINSCINLMPPNQMHCLIIY